MSQNYDEEINSDAFEEVIESGDLDVGTEMDFADPVPDTALSRGFPSRPLLGALPLARLIPQDVHSVMDYVDAAAVLTGAASSCPKARTVSALLGAGGIAVSSVTDYRLSVRKWIPIETHEAIDHLWGLAAIALPFVLGYYKTAPAVATSHVLTGAGNILASLFTDYRAYRGVGRTAPAGT